MTEAFFYDVPNADPIHEFPPAHGKFLGKAVGEFETYEDVPVKLLDTLRPEGYLCVCISKGAHTISTVLICELASKLTRRKP